MHHITDVTIVLRISSAVLLEVYILLIYADSALCHGFTVLMVSFISWFLLFRRIPSCSDRVIHVILLVSIPYYSVWFSWDILGGLNYIIFFFSGSASAF